MDKGFTSKGNNRNEKTTGIIFKVYKTQTKLQGYSAMQCLATLSDYSDAVIRELS